MTITGEEFARRRRALGLSQDALAELLGLSRRTVVRIERSTHVRRMDEMALHGVAVTLAGIAKAITEPDEVAA